MPIDKIEKVITEATREADNVAKPFRDSLFKRYPTLSTLLVTIGVSATFLGIEQIILEIDFLQNHPGVILLIGVAILFFTGRLYKKLS